MHTAGTGLVAERDRRDIRPVWDLAGIGADHDAAGYPIMALWMACFIRAYEATFLADAS